MLSAWGSIGFSEVLANAPELAPGIFTNGHLLYHYSIGQWQKAGNRKKNILTTHGKPAGIPCVQLLPDYRCLPFIALAREGALFSQPERPAFCVSLRPTEEMCGANRAEALVHLAGLELATRP